MQAVRCFRFFYQCPSKASLFKCFTGDKNVSPVHHRNNLGRLYMCTKSILNKADASAQTDPADLSDGPDPTLGGPGVSGEWSAEVREDTLEDQSLDYFKSLVTSSPSKLMNKEEQKESQIEKKLRIKTSDLKNLKPTLPVKSGNLAAYVNESDTLTQLVQLGTNLSVVEKNQEAATHLLKVDFETGVKPYLEFLLRLGVSETDLGAVLTRNPALLMEDIDDLEVRINYLKSKKFDDTAIARIITKAPLFLSQSTKATDAQLGFIQKLFYLRGPEVRQVVTSYPKLTTWPRGLLQDVHFIFKEFLGFSGTEQKEMLLFQPKVYTSNRKKLEDTFDYLHNTMHLSHTEICRWPQIFRTRLFIIKQRHSFLESIGRAQYDPKKENFVSLKALVSGKDAEFCANVAKVPVSHFNSYLKTL